MPTQHFSSSSQHLDALDWALAKGLDIKVGDTDFRFKPLRYTDLGEMLVIARSKAMTAYEMTAQAMRAKHTPIYHRDRIMDVNAIMFGMAPQDIRSLLQIPEVATLMLTKSLRDHTPKLTAEQVRMFLDDEETIASLLETIISMTLGPANPDDLQREPEANENENPTQAATEAA